MLGGRRPEVVGSMQPSRQVISTPSPAAVVPSGRLVGLHAPALAVSPIAAGLEVVGELAAAFKQSQGIPSITPLLRPIGELQLEPPVSRIVMGKDLQKWWERLNMLARAGTIDPIGLGYPPQFLEVRAWGGGMGAVDQLSMLLDPEFRLAGREAARFIISSDIVFAGLEKSHAALFRNVQLHIIPKSSLTDIRTARHLFKEAFEHAREWWDDILRASQVAPWRSKIQAAGHSLRLRSAA